MVYVTDGTRPGSTKPDPTRDLPAPAGTYCPHIKSSLHGQTVLVRPNDVRRSMKLALQSQAVDNFDSGSFGVAADNNFDAQIKGAPVDTILNVWLHFYVFNQNAVGGNAITMMHPAAFWNRYEVMANGGSTDDTIYDMQIYQDFMNWLSSDQERSAYSQFLGTERQKANTDTALPYATWTQWDETGNSIAAQARREYWFPIICFLTLTSLWTCTKKVDPKIRIYGNVNPILSSNNTADLATTNIRFQQMELYFQGIKFQPEIRARINDHILQGPLYLRTITHDRLQQSIASIVANVYLTDIQLTPFSGEYAGLVVFVNRNDATREGAIYGCLRTYAAATWSPLPLANMTFNDSSGVPVYFNDIHSNFFRVVEAGMGPNAEMRMSKNYYTLMFATDPDTTLRSGLSTGGLAMDGNYTLKLQLASGFTAGATTAVQATVIGYRYSILCMEPNGNFRIIRL